MQHSPGVATDGKLATCFYVVVFIQHQAMGVVGDSAAVDDGLTVILTGAFSQVGRTLTNNKSLFYILL